MPTASPPATKLHFTASVDSLLEATTKVLSVVPVKSPKPVLSNIRISVREGILELSGTDFATGIHYSVPAATVKSSGSGLLNGIKFAELLKEFRGAEVEIAFNARGGCSFKSKGGRYKVVGDDIRDYPKSPRFDRKPGLTILGSEVVDMVKKTLFAAAPEESRLTTNGVLFQLKGQRFRLVATDNKRMSITERTLDTAADEFSVSVPANFLKAVLKVTTKDVSTKNVTIGVDGRRVFYSLPSATVYTTVLQGNYPPYEEALGIKLRYHTDCGVKDLLNTLRRAMLVNANLIAFNLETGTMYLNGASSTVGAGTSSMEIDFDLPDGDDPVRVGFNPAYLKGALEVMTSKRCRFLFEGPRNAGILREIVEAAGVESVSDQFVYAVMPALLPEGL